MADHLCRHLSGPSRAWRAEHPRVQHAFLPSGAAWLTLIAGCWRRFRRQAFAGAALANADALAAATRIATAQLNRQATPWGWGRPARARATTTPDASSLFHLSPMRNHAVTRFASRGRL